MPYRPRLLALANAVPLTCALFVSGPGVALARDGVNVGEASILRNIVPADELEQSAGQQYDQILAQARKDNALAPARDPQLERLHAIARRLIAQTPMWNARAAAWHWQVNLVRKNEVNAFCMPGGKIVFFTGLLNQVKPSDDEIAIVMGHEMAHALREHARVQIAKNALTHTGLSLGAQLLGLGDFGSYAANIGGQLLSLRYSRTDESDADLVGLEIAARAGFNPNAAITLWRKMSQAQGGAQNLEILSSHPVNDARIAELQANIPRVMPLYEAARRTSPGTGKP